MTNAATQRIRVTEADGSQWTFEVPVHPRVIGTLKPGESVSLGTFGELFAPIYEAYEREAVRREYGTTLEDLGK